MGNVGKGLGLRDGFDGGLRCSEEVIRGPRFASRAVSPKILVVSRMSINLKGS
jgi:hypothetical protein